MWVPEEEEERENSKKYIFKEIITENFPNQKKETHADLGSS